MPRLVGGVESGAMPVSHEGQPQGSEEEKAVSMYMTLKCAHLAIITTAGPLAIAEAALASAPAGTED